MNAPQPPLVKQEASHGGQQRLYKQMVAIHTEQIVPSVVAALAIHSHDNVVLVCADGGQVHTSALLLAFISPCLADLLKESQSDAGEAELCIVLPHVDSDRVRAVIGRLLAKEDMVDGGEIQEVFGVSCSDAFKPLEKSPNHLFDKERSFCRKNTTFPLLLQQAKVETFDEPFNVKHEPIEELEVKPNKIKPPKIRTNSRDAAGKLSAYLLKKYGTEEHYQEHRKNKKIENPEGKTKRKKGIFTPFLLRKYGSQEAWEEHRKQKRTEKCRNICFTPKTKLCPHCGEEFSISDTKSEGAYSRHMKIHTIEKFSCECEQSWKTSREKNFHMKRVHMGHFGCEPCVRTFASEDVFKSHMELTHSGAKFFICDECGFETHTKGNLQIHTQLSHDKELQTCNICGAQFEGTYRLKAHLKRTHNELKPCPYCGQFFKNIPKHINTSHTADSEKKYQCKECGKGFIDITKLNGHMMNVHIRSRPYHCRYQCGVSYNDRGNRNGHERSKHGQLWDKVETGEETQGQLWDKGKAREGSMGQDGLLSATGHN